MDHLDHIDAIRLRALRAAWKPDYEASLRRIFRWYSEKFHTPLDRVPDLPLDLVLMNYFEAHYEACSPEERHEAALDLIQTPEEVRERLAEEQDSEDAFIRETQRLVEQQRAEASLKNRVAEVRKGLETLATPTKPRRELKESSLPKSKPPEEDEITLTFTEEPLDLEESGFAPPKKK